MAGVSRPLVGAVQRSARGWHSLAHLCAHSTHSRHELLPTAHCPPGSLRPTISAEARPFGACSAPREGAGGLMCGIVGILYKQRDRYGPVGEVQRVMLDALFRRGIDSAGIALYGEPRDGELVLRARVSDAGSAEAVVAAVAGSPDDLGAHPGDGTAVQVRYAPNGAGIAAVADAAEAAAGGVHVDSIGTALEIVKGVGHADELEQAAPYRAFVGSHAIGHTRMATESRVDVHHAHPFW